MYKLSNTAETIIRKFDNAHIQFNELNPDYLAYLDWLEQGNEPEPADIIVEELSPKLKGVLFQGVWCSATKQDQDGLLAVLVAYQMQGASFKPTRYDFTNGNSLVLNKDNVQQFIATWMPFRQSFFTAEESV